LLAEAAARQLWKWRMQDPFVVVNTLTNILDNGLLDRGELGELTGRHLLLDAYLSTILWYAGTRVPFNSTSLLR